MIIDLNPLLSGIKKVIEINETIVFSSSDLKNTSIKKLDKVYVTGTINKVSDESVDLKININTVMTLEDSVTLEDVNYPININIHKVVGNVDDDGEYYKILQNTLDILPIVWENIVLEVPLRIVNNERETVIEGDGWSLNKDNSNSPLSDLKEMLDMEERR